jgi:DNA replication protein DnaC
MTAETGLPFAATQPVVVAAIRESCRRLRLPTVGAECERLAKESERQGQGLLGYLNAVLETEVDEREHKTVARRLSEARFPRVKTLEEFDFTKAPHLPAGRILALSEGGYLERSEPVIFLGECGSGKTHLATGLCVAACRQRQRVRFVTAVGLVNELTEAQHAHALNRSLARWTRYDLICIDEMGYVPLLDHGAELLFGVISERAERASVIVTTNLPFSEWTSVFPNPRLCKALLDRLTDRAHLIETGRESYRFRRTLEQRREPRPDTESWPRPDGPEPDADPEPLDGPNPPEP